MYLRRYYIGSPQDLLRNEWVVFAGIFLLTFAVIYFSISKFFIIKKKADWRDILEGKNDLNKIHPAAMIISIVIALFTATSVSRYGPFYDYFATILGAWMLLFVLIIMFILSLPFFKALKSSFGDKWFMGGILGIGLAIAYWYFFKSYLFYELFSHSFSGWSYSFYSYLNSPGGLVLLIIFFGVFGAILPTKKRI